jgi:hypothetical protein
MGYPKIYERKMPSGKIVKFWSEDESPLFAFCLKCNWKGESKDLPMTKTHFGPFECCPNCKSTRVGQLHTCPDCLSPDKTESQGAYLVDNLAYPCSECEKKLNMVFDHDWPDADYNPNIHGVVL